MFPPPFRAALILNLAMAFVFAAYAVAAEDARTFTVTPAEPPSPALKYLLRSDAGPCEPGNAADFYAQAEKAMADGAIEKAIWPLYDEMQAPEQASDFNKRVVALADKYRAVFDALERGGRQENYDRHSNLSEEGISASLPYLNTAHSLGVLLRLRAVRQIRTDDVAGAIGTLRIAYDFARNIGRQPTMIDNLVAASIIREMIDPMAELIGRPDSPNLYFAISSLPRPMFRLSEMIQSRGWNFTETLPLSKFEFGAMNDAQWRAAIHQILRYTPTESGKILADQPQIDDMLRMLPQAQKYFVQTYPGRDPAKLTPLQMVGAYCFEQYQITTDEQLKWMSMPYPTLLPKLDASVREFIEMRKHQPFNPFLELVGSPRQYTDLAIIERQLAALATVEAIRAYASDNNGAVPNLLSDLVDTPAPDNPRTGKPFEYVAPEPGVAEISDPDSADDPLTYTIRIRR